MLLAQQPVGASLANQDISLTSFDPNYAAIQRQQRLAELLSQQANAPIEINSGGGAQAPINPLAALAKGFQGYAGAYLDKKAQDKAATLQQGYRKELADQLSHFYQQPGAGMPNMPAQQTAINATAPAIPGAPPPQQNTVNATIPGQTGGPVPTSTQDQMAQSLQMMGSGNPYMQNIAPQLYAAALNRGNMDYQHGVQRQDKLDDLKLPMSTAAQQQIDAQAAAQRGTAQFTNQLPETAHDRATDALGWAKVNEERDYHKAMTGGNISVSDPTALAYAGGVQTGNMTFQSIPKAYKNSVAMILQNSGDPLYSPLSMTRNTLASERIAAPYKKMPGYDLTAGAQTYLDRINASLKHPGSVADQDLLDSLTKLNTGGNAITDAQVGIITKGKSFSDTLNTYANKLKTGGVLSDDQRQQIGQIANEIATNYRKSYQPIYDMASKQLTAAKIPKQFWTIPDLNALSVARAAADAAPAKPGAAAAPGTSFNGLTNPGSKNDPLGLR